MVRQTYTTKPPKRGLTIEDAKRYLMNLVDSSDKTVYTSLINLNGENHRFSYVMMFIIDDGKPINISYYAGFISGMRMREAITDFVQVPKGIDVGKYAVSQLQRALYEDVIMKERLRQEWV